MNIMYVNHIAKLASTEEIQDALNNGTLAQPYVVLASGGTLYYNEVTTPAPQTMGVWSDDGEGTYTFKINDTDYTNWSNEVNIGTLVDVFYERDADMNIKLSAPSSGSWHLEFYDPEVTLNPSYDFTVGVPETWENMGVMVDSSDSHSGVVVSWDGVDTFTFSDGSQDATLEITTIDPAGE